LGTGFTTDLRVYGDEVAGFGLVLTAIVGSVNAGATQHLAGVGNGADVRIDGRDAQVGLFDTAVAAFESPMPSPGG